MFSTFNGVYEISSIGDNLLRVLGGMDQAARRAGRDSGEIKLVAVSKTVESSRIRGPIEAGATMVRVGTAIFGERRY